MCAIGQAQDLGRKAPELRGAGPRSECHSARSVTIRLPGGTSRLPSVGAWTGLESGAQSRMWVVFVRHGIAVEREDWAGPDSRRPLTPRGRRRTKRAIGGLQALLPAGVQILTSPSLRARETAESWVDSAGEETSILSVPWMRPGQLAAAKAALPKLDCQTVVLVGHEPELSRLLGWATGFPLPPLKKAGAAAVEFRGDVAQGRAELRWYLPPRVLRSLTSR